MAQVVRAAVAVRVVGISCFPHCLNKSPEAEGVRRELDGAGKATALVCYERGKPSLTR